MNKNLERFINYVKIDTQSSNDESSTPSTKKQFDLANLLINELKDLNVEASVNDKGIVYAFIPANSDVKCQTLGLIAHLDTATDCSGYNVKPKIIENYNGLPIYLGANLYLDPKEYPSLKTKISHTLITTSGDTLLGADDKAGIAIIMGVVDYIVTHPDFKHGDIKIAFTPDEEVGRGTENFDVALFNADLAYTLDGSIPQIVEYENFNAASAKVKINGISIHPGTAKDKMINAAEVAMEFHQLLPEQDKPQHTEGYQGFNHLTDISGGVDTTILSYIIRNHDKHLLETQKQLFWQIEKRLNEKYQYKICEVTIKDSYQNMKEYLKDKMEVVEIAYQALTKNGYNPTSSPIRGGTDGASLTYQGLPCPNLGTGGYNFHGKYEYLDLNELEKMIGVVIDIISILANNS